MEIKTLSNSSVETFDSCENKYAIQYLLGIKQDDNVAAVVGSIFHCIMEILAFITKNKTNKYNDEIVGDIEVDDNMIQLTELVFKKYQEKYPHLDLTHTHLVNCKRWVKRTLEDNGGRNDPRNLEIIDIEKWFDFDFDSVNVRGFIDLVTKDDDDTYRVLDYKTGSDWDYKLNRKKDYESLNKNFQLRLYHYICSKQLYPNIKNIITEIFYVNTYKMYSFFWGPEELYKVEIFLNKKIDRIRAVEKPKLNLNACKICSFDKHEYKDSGKTICEFMRDAIEEKGLEKVTQEYKIEKKTT